MPLVEVKLIEKVFTPAQKRGVENEVRSGKAKRELAIRKEPSQQKAVANSAAGF